MDDSVLDAVFPWNNALGLLMNPERVLMMGEGDYYKICQLIEHKAPEVMTEIASWKVHTVSFSTNGMGLVS